VTIFYYPLDSLREFLAEIPQNINIEYIQVDSPSPTSVASGETSNEMKEADFKWMD